MKAVIDTNVVAYLLLGTEAFVDESRACLERVATPLAPAHSEAELTNVVWMAIRAGVLPCSARFPTSLVVLVISWGVDSPLECVSGRTAGGGE